MKLSCYPCIVAVGFVQLYCYEVTETLVSHPQPHGRGIFLPTDNTAVLKENNRPTVSELIVREEHWSPLQRNYVALRGAHCKRRHPRYRRLIRPELYTYRRFRIDLPSRHMPVFEFDLRPAIEHFFTRGRRRIPQDRK